MVLLSPCSGGVADVPHPALSLHVGNSVVALLLREPAAQSESETEAEEEQGGSKQEQKDKPPWKRGSEVETA